MNILVIAAHPDDEVLGCGGTIARLTTEGHAVMVGILGEGATSRARTREEGDVAAVDALRTRSRQAGQCLGVRDIRFAGLPDNRFDSVALLDVVKILEKWVAEVQPSRVYTQHGGDLNIDHCITYRATLTATRPLHTAVVTELLAYEVASSTEWAFGKFEPAFRPNVFVNIASTLERKIQAMALYESETRAFPHPRSPENLRACATRWGSVAGVNAAEAFELIRDVQ